MKPTVSTDLVGFETLREAEYLERLAADDDLVRLLQLSRFDLATDEWRSFARALAEYGYAVFRAWLGTGEIVRRLAARSVRGQSSLPTPFRLSEDEVGELAAELMIRGISSFRENVLLKGKWRADGGATLKTYFVGHLLFLVPTVFQRWQRDSGRGEVVFDPAAPPRHPMVPSGTERADARVLLGDVQRVLPHDVLQMFKLQAEGWSLSVIAADLNVNTSKVKTDMMRARPQMAQRFPDGKEWLA